MGKAKTKLNVTIGSTQLKESDEKYEVLPGCYFQCNLKWGKQITRLKSKLTKRIVGVYSIRNLLPHKTLKIICEGWFNSVLVYCLPLFGGCSKGDLQDLQIIQNKLARLILFSPRDTNRATMFETLQWMTVNQLITYHTLLVVFRIRKSGEPEDLALYFLRENRNNNIIIPQSNMELYRKSFVYRAINSWNYVPKDLRNIQDQFIFKKNLKKWIMVEVKKFQ